MVCSDVLGWPGRDRVSGMSGGGPDGRALEAAWRAMQFARTSAEHARRAAEVAAKAAAMRERLLDGSPEAAAELRVQTIAMHRKSEACQRTAERMLTTFARRLAKWAAHEDAAALLRPVFMHDVAQTAGWGGVVLTLRDGAGGEVLVAASDEWARRVHELQVTLGEGPTVEAARGRTSIVYGTELARRWPRFGEVVGGMGVQAAAGIPLDWGPHHAPGSLTAVGPPMPDQRGDLRGLQEVAGALDQGILRSPHVAPGPDPELPGLEMFEQADYQPALHQAAGALHVRLGCNVDDALALIRAHAYAEDRSVAEVAHDVLARRLWTAG